MPFDQERVSLDPLVDSRRRRVAEGGASTGVDSSRGGVGGSRNGALPSTSDPAAGSADHIDNIGARDSTDPPRLSLSRH